MLWYSSRYDLHGCLSVKKQLSIYLVMVRKEGMHLWDAERLEVL